MGSENISKVPPSRDDDHAIKRKSFSKEKLEQFKRIVASKEREGNPQSQEMILDPKLQKSKKNISFGEKKEKASVKKSSLFDVVKEVSTEKKQVKEEDKSFPLEDFSKEIKFKSRDVLLEKAKENYFIKVTQAPPVELLEAPINQVSLSTDKVSPTSRMAELKLVIDKLVDKLYVLKDKGLTEIGLELKHPPLVAGATIKITGFDSARGEFNVSFQNLTQQAKYILDNAHNALKLGMEEKGFVVHIISTFTQDYTTGIKELTKTDQQGNSGNASKDHDGREKERREKKER
jgi:hypothetical protein